MNYGEVRKVRVYEDAGIAVVRTFKKFFAVKSCNVIDYSCLGEPLDPVMIWWPRYIVRERPMYQILHSDPDLSRIVFLTTFIRGRIL